MLGAIVGACFCVYDRLRRVVLEEWVKGKREMVCLRGSDSYITLGQVRSGLIRLGKGSCFVFMSDD